MKNKFVLFFVCAILLFSSTAILIDANTIKITNDNNPPNPPDIIGPILGKPGEIYRYQVAVSDPDESDGLIRLEIDFGDEIITKDPGCCGALWENPETIEVSHIWKNTGNYKITGRVQDIAGIWSEWSDPLSVSMPKTKTYFDSILQKIFLFLPNIYKIK